ncbi:Uncharacterised protein [Mycobacterium tuberculosis]|nr:Uncharacterised protein [Mycobacterium tuberculosis]
MIDNDNAGSNGTRATMEASKSPLGRTVAVPSAVNKVRAPNGVLIKPVALRASSSPVVELTGAAATDK